MHEFKVNIIETVVRPVIVVAETPTDAQRIAEDDYLHSEVADVKFEVELSDR